MHTPKGWWQNSGLTWVFYRLYHYNGDCEEVLLNCSANIFHSRREITIAIIVTADLSWLLTVGSLWLNRSCFAKVADDLSCLYTTSTIEEKLNIRKQHEKISQNMANMLTIFRLTGAGKKNEVMTNPTGIVQETKIILITRPRLIKFR